MCTCNTCFMHRMEPIEDHEYVINERPIPWARAVPAFSKHFMYDSQKAAKLAIGAIIKKQHGSKPLFKGPLHIDVVFYTPYASSKQLRKRQERKKYVDVKSDLDNYCKFLLDTCNTLLYTDDKQIASISAAKIYSDKPRTEFTIKELNEE